MTSFQTQTKILTLILAVIMVAALFTGCEKAPEALDYSNKDFWAIYGSEEAREADVFLICPTVDMGENGDMNMDMNNQKALDYFIGALNLQRGLYEETAAIYSPYYRQMTFPAGMLEDAEEQKPYRELAYTDVRAAFEYYMENINNGRPLIIAGFSQGSQHLITLLGEFFDDPEYNELLVAAYCIGWRVTEEDLKEFPHLKMAQGEDDTGVIIAFNTEAESVDDSFFVPKGMKTYAINPLNWKTDSTPADKTLNKGACFIGYDGILKEEIPQLTGAYIDETRGTLKVPDIDVEEYSSSLFPEGVYHLNDYIFFYRNLQENVAVRVESYLNN